MKRTLIASAIEAIVRRFFDTIEPSSNSYVTGTLSRGPQFVIAELQRSITMLQKF